MSFTVSNELSGLLNEQYGKVVTERIVSGFVRRPVTLRANTLKTSADAVFEILDRRFSVSRVPWSSEAFIVEGADEGDIRALSEYSEGHIYLQSLSSMLPPIILDPKAGESILDMCAAPGGKTTQMAALSGGRADITACEKNKVRAERLRYNLSRQGAGRVSTMVCDSRNLDDMFFFDKILLDAPCSGSGTVTPENCGFTLELYERSKRTQRELLKKAIKLLKPGHTLVYSTCSVLSGENEDVVSAVLSETGAKLLNIDTELFKGVPLLPTKLDGVITVCPSELYEGFFAAKIEKNQA